MSYNESLNPNSNYPAMSQSDWDSAPWNKESDPEPIEVEVTVSVTLSKTFKVYTSNYNYWNDGEVEGVDIDNSKLYDDVIEQCILPQDAYKYINGNTDKGKAAIEDLKDWDVDDMEVNRD